MQWTEQHDAFCLAHKIPPSARLLWQWALRQKSVGEIEGIEFIELFLKDFNAWVGRIRPQGAFNARTLKNAIAKLGQCRVFGFFKEYAWDSYRLVVRSLDTLTPKKKYQKRTKNSNPSASNPHNAEQTFSQQQPSLSEADSLQKKIELCELAGLLYPPGSDEWMKTFSLAEIARAILYFFASGANNLEKVRSPMGWFRRCVEFDWAGNAEDYYTSYQPDKDYHALYKRLGEILHPQEGFD